MSRVDIYSYHKKGKYPRNNAAVAAVLGIIAIFFIWGTYSIWSLWSMYGSQIMTLIQSLGLPSLMTQNATTILAIVGGIIILSLILAIGAAKLAKRLGATLIYIGAIGLNIITFGFALLPVFLGVLTISDIMQNWGILIPGLFTLFITILLVTVFRGRVKTAGKIIKLTGRVCLDEKGVFIPPMLSMIFTLLSAMMMGAIIFQFVPIDVLLGNETLTIENGWPIGVGFILYTFLTIFFYNFAYATSSTITYIYIRGRDPTLGDGVRGALGVIGGLAVLSVLSVIISIIRAIIRGITRRSGPAARTAGRAASGAIGFAWMLINYFTIPVMVAENKSATDGIKRSINLVRKNFVDVIIKETGVRWAFAVLAFMMFLGFGIGGAIIGWILTSSLMISIIMAVLFLIIAGIPSTLVLRTFDIVYVTLLYVFIRKKEGEIKAKTKIPADMEKTLNSAYSKARG